MKAFQIFKNQTVLLLIITLSGFILRIAGIQNNPPGLTWDEASLGYNAYSILKTAADEYGNRFPLSFRSFDDYKPPAYVYFSIPFIKLFGLNELGIRFLSILAGTFLIPTVYFISRLLFTESKIRIKNSVGSFIPLFSAILIALSPWSIQHSRGAFEGNLGIWFLSLGLFFLFKGLKNSKYYLLSVFMLGLSMYSYHSFRLVAPLLIGFFIVLFWKKLLTQKVYAIVSIGFLTLVTFPIFYSMFFSEGAGSRLSMVTRYSSFELLAPSIKRLEQARKEGDTFGIIVNNRRLVYLQTTIVGYLDHFDLDYLFFHGDSGKHHHALNMGVLYLFELPLLIFGIIYILKRLSKKIVFLLIWLLIAPLPSAITTGTPHAIRSIAMMPVFHILSAAGLAWLVVFISGKKWGKIKLGYPVISIILLCISLNVIYFLNQYFVVTPIAYADFWQSENKKLYSLLHSKENNYDKIIVTYWYDQPYVYYLFYNKIDPAWYQSYWNKEGHLFAGRFHRLIGKYEFRNIDYGKNSDFNNTIIVGSPEEIPDFVSYEPIMFPDGKDAYRILYNK